MVARSAARQLDQDAPMLLALAPWYAAHDMIRPNLMLVTGPQHDHDEECFVECDEDHGILFPVLDIRGG
jgi:hypothetical protein